MFVDESCEQRAVRFHHTRRNGWNTYQGRRPASFAEVTVHSYTTRQLNIAESGYLLPGTL